MADIFKDVEPLVYKSQINVPYNWWAGDTASKFLCALRDEQKILGTKCGKCSRVFVPPRKNCPTCFKPNKEWMIIKDEDHSFRDLFIDYAGPLMTLGSITIFIRNLFLEYSLLGNILYALIFFISMLGSMYISSLVINELSSSFGLQRNISRFYTLVIYSSTAIYLTKAITNLNDQLSILIIFSLYSVYLFWLGSEKMFQIDDSRKMGFVVISSLLIFLTFELLQRIILSIFDALKLLV